MHREPSTALKEPAAQLKQSVAPGEGRAGVKDINHERPLEGGGVKDKNHESGAK